jgi:NAD(P)-dependent dehydrogenase (short-subunit alcohol dehydrogenase family)
MFELADKRALITGAGSGIGEAVARVFAAQGAKVLVGDVQADAAERVAASICEQGGVASALVLDVADEASVRSVFDGLASRGEHLSIVVNNAGVSHVGSILETSLDAWEQVMSVNARGVFLCAREAVRLMLLQKPAGGVIINMASVAAMIGLERRLPYSASKGAVLALTRSIAIDFVDQGIRCNAICPGTVHTPIVEGYLKRSYPGQEDTVRQTLHARQPLGRMGLPEEIAAAALYLASDEAAFITGSALVIDGGWTAK